VATVTIETYRQVLYGALCALALAAMTSVAYAAGGESPRSITYPPTPNAPAQQSEAAARSKTGGCLTCHEETDQISMHENPGVILGCTDCHGGDTSARKPAGSKPGDAAYRAVLDQSHVQPRFPKYWQYPKSATPPRSYTMLNLESPEFIRFINPSDYRVAREACGACHLPEILAAERSLMSTAAMFWGGRRTTTGSCPSNAICSAHRNSPSKGRTALGPSHGAIPSRSGPSWRPRRT